MVLNFRPPVFVKTQKDKIMQLINKNIFFLLAALIVASFSSCDEDTFSQVVEVEIPDHQSSIVLNGIWSTQDSTLELLVTTSLSILDTEAFTIPQAAEINLFTNGSLLGSLNYDEDIAQYSLM
ncbi:MAG: hypothetical protein DWQ02_09115, partial [Bacteroidetes bacterium]